MGAALRVGKWSKADAATGKATGTCHLPYLPYADMSSGMARTFVFKMGKMASEMLLGWIGGVLEV